VAEAIARLKGSRSMAIVLADVFRARQRIAPYVRRTPLVAAEWLSDATGAEVLLKLESLQVGHTFKSRGAYNAVIARLERGEITRESTIVTASAGNHGRGLAAAAQHHELRLVVFTPIDAPQTKLNAIRRHGATLRAEGRDYDHAELLAKRYAAESGAIFISPYSDLDVIAGAATVALEIVEDAPEVDLIVVPIGGGGLISGVGVTAKSIGGIRVVGVELDVAFAFLTGIRAGRLVKIVAGESIAEGLGGNPDPETITFGFIQQYVDDIVTVSEASLRSAVVGLVEHAHLVVEPSGAAGIAALEDRRLDVRGLRVAVVVTGSNIDRSRLSELLVRS
jgi:threonine dehydratase